MRPLILMPTINSRNSNACYLQLLSVQRCQHPPQAERSCGGGSARIARVHAFLLSTHPLTCLEHTGSATTHKNNGQPDVRSRKISIFSRQRPREP